MRLPKPKKRKAPLTQEQLITERIHQIRIELDEKVKTIKKNLRLRG